MRDRSHDKSQEGFLDTWVDQLGSPAHLLVITHPCSHSLRKPPSVITSQQSGGYVQSACVIESLLFVDWKQGWERVDLEERAGGGRSWEDWNEDETIVRVYCIREKSIFNIKQNFKKGYDFLLFFSFISFLWMLARA